MQCPYCAEEIKDQANYCRYCGHDLSFFKMTQPMLESVSSLEDQVSSLKDQISSLEEQVSSLAGQISESPAAIHTPPGDRTPITHPDAREVSHFRHPALVAGLLILVLITSQVLYDVLTGAHVSATEELQMIHSNPLGWEFNWADILFIGAPLVAGGWLRIKQRQKRLKPYIVLGVFVGVVTEAVMILLEYTVVHPPFLTVEDEIAEGIFRFADVVTLIRGVGVDVAVIAMLFAAGGMFGGLIDAWKSNRSITEQASISRHIVKKIVSPDNPLFEEIVKVLTVLYAPTLTFAASVLGILYGAGH